MANEILGGTMCFLIVEVLMFIVGVWTLVTGRIPESLFRILFGKGGFTLSSVQVRLFGLLIASPLLLALIAGLILGVFFGEEGTSAAGTFEFLYLVMVAIAAVIIVRIARRPVSD
jgi:hypothetical protein